MTAGVTPPYVPVVSTLINSIGTSVVTPITGAVAVGAAMSGHVEVLASQQLGAAKAKGINARGIPPRGRRWV
jgi:hypothetical protein